MKKIITTVFLALAFTFSMQINAQAINKKEDKLQKEQHKLAEDFAKRAQVHLEAGNLKFADSLIRLSINTYPTLEVYYYADELMRLSDIKGANNLLAMLFTKVEEMPYERLIMMWEPGGRSSAINQLLNMRKVNVLHEHAVRNLKSNNALGTFESIMKSYQRVMDNLVEPQSAMMSTSGDDLFFKPRVIEQFGFRFEYWLMQGKEDEALKYIEKQPDKRFIKKEDYIPWKIKILMNRGQYEEALSEVKNVSKQMAPILEKSIRDRMGTASDTSVNPYADQLNVSAGYYENALIRIANKNYEAAIADLKKAMAARGKANYFGFVKDKYPWFVYKAFGDAYAGLKDYEKARDHYKIALLYYPDFKDGKEALAKLESIYSNELAVDKTIPVISLLEPSPQRGLIVTSTGTTVMIKGLAIDPSGIKAVTINGQPVYSQPGGDFWGEVALKTGINKISIAATDVAGNKAEQVFEIEKKSGESKLEQKEGKSYALLIAAQNYTDNNIPSLDNPVADAIKLKLILKNNYSFPEANIITLFNPEVNDVKRQLLELTNTIQPEDNLVIFYAGHGLWVEKEKKGYWLLTDSKRYDAATWLPNKVVLDLIAKLPSRHTLLITDACFSGSVFKTRGLGDAPVAIQQINEKISRVAITSGNDTEVPDKSVFMKYLVKALSENKEKYMTAQKMFINQIIEAVMTETKTEPRYGTLELAGHVGGDYIFMRK